MKIEGKITIEVNIYKEEKLCSFFVDNIVLLAVREEELRNTLNRMDTLLTVKFVLKLNRCITRIMKSSRNVATCEMDDSIGENKLEKKHHFATWRVR